MYLSSTIQHTVRSHGLLCVSYFRYVIEFEYSQTPPALKSTHPRCNSHLIEGL